GVHVQRVTDRLLVDDLPEQHLSLVLDQRHGGPFAQMHPAASRTAYSPAAALGAALPPGLTARRFSLGVGFHQPLAWGFGCCLSPAFPAPLLAGNRGPSPPVHPRKAPDDANDCTDREEDDLVE